MTKEYLALIYGIDINLPDDDFYKQIIIINNEAEKVTQRILERSNKICQM